MQELGWLDLELGPELRRAVGSLLAAECESPELAPASLWELSPPGVHEGVSPGGTLAGWRRHRWISTVGEALLSGVEELGRFLDRRVARALLRDRSLPRGPERPPVPPGTDLWLLLSEVARELHDRHSTLIQRLSALCLERAEEVPREAHLRIRATNLFLDAVLTSGARSGLSTAGEVSKGLEEAGLARDAGYARTASGLACFFTGRVEPGLDQLECALKHFQAVGDPVGIVLVENSRAGLKRQVGEIQVAARHVSRALEVAEHWGLERRRAALLGNLATLEAETGRAARAEELYLEAVRANHRLGLAHQAVSSLLNLAPIFLNDGRSEDARACLEGARRWGPVEEDPRIEQTLLITELTLHLRTARHASARDALRRLRRSLRSYPDPWASARLESDLGILLLKQGKPRAALAHLRSAQDYLSGPDGRQDRWQILLRIGKVLLTLERREEALDTLRESIRELEDVGASLTAEHLRIPYLEGRREPYLLLLEQLMQAEATGDRAEETHSLSQGLKARVLRERLSSGLGGLAVTVEPGLLREEQDAEVRLRALQKVHEEQPGNTAISKRLDSARREHRRLLEQLALRSPGEVREAGLLPAPSAREVADTLQEPGVALVEYLCGRDASYAWLFRDQEIRSFRLPAPRAAVEEAVKDLEGVLAHPTSIERLQDLRSDRLHELYQRLLEPMKDHLEGVQRLILATDPPLHRIPFSALLTAPPNSAVCGMEETSRLSFLMDRFSLEQAPSSSVLTLDRPSEEHDFAEIPLLVLGDPDYPQSALHLPRLPHSRSEAEGLGAVVPGARIFLDREATPETYRSLAPRARWIHLAAHGRCGVKEAIHVGVALSPTRAAPDGFLRSYEIARIPIRAELVVLSCCETALGESRSGEGLMGLARAFFLAGARRVLVTLWPVVDEATRALMLDFYRSMRKGMKSGEALRDAQQRCRRRWMELAGAKRPLGHPFYWSPYVIVTSVAR